jgi:hypothetical protein
MIHRMGMSTNALTASHTPDDLDLYLTPDILQSSRGLRALIGAERDRLEAGQLA